MIRCIGKDDYGLYTLAYSVISLFVFDFGISTAIQRFTAKYLAEKNEKKVNECISLVYKLYFYLDAIIFLFLIAVFFFIPTIYREFSAEQTERLKVVFAIVSCYSIISFPFIPLNGILSAYEKFIQLKSCDLISKVLTVCINVTCLYLGGGLYSLVISNAMVGLFVIIIKYIIVQRETSIKVSFNYNNKQELHSLLFFSGWTTIAALCQRCIFNIAPSILGLFAGASEIAVLGIATSLEAYTFTFAFAINGLFLPKVSRLLVNNDSVLPLMIKVGRIQFLTIGAILVGFLVIGKDFIIAWIGEGFESAYICTLLLIAPSLMLVSADIADQTLIANNNVKPRAFVFVAMAIVNIILSLFFTSIWGIYGLAASIFTAYMVRNILLYYLYYKLLKINIFFFIRETFIKMSAGLLPALFLSFFICSFIQYTGWATVLLKFIVTSVCYTIFMYIFAINKEEINLIKSIIKQ